MSVIDLLLANCIFLAVVLIIFLALIIKISPAQKRKDFEDEVEQIKNSVSADPYI